MKKYNADSTRKNTRCGHGWCSACATRKGSNVGNRRLRHHIKQLLRKGFTDGE